MPLETGLFISDLVVSNPPSGDPFDEGDDHIRLIKSVLKNTFPNLTGPVQATHTELNNAASGSGSGEGDTGLWQGSAFFVGTSDPDPSVGSVGDFFFVLETP